MYWTSASVLGLLDSARWVRGTATLQRIMREREEQRRLEAAERKGNKPATTTTATATTTSSDEYVIPEQLKKAAQEKGRGKGEDVEGLWFRHFARLTVGTGAAVVGVMVACTVLRTHLFIWTVFSPKFLFAMAWAVGFHLVVSGGLGAAIWTVGF